MEEPRDDSELKVRARSRAELGEKQLCSTSASGELICWERLGQPEWGRRKRSGERWVCEPSVYKLSWCLQMRLSSRRLTIWPCSAAGELWPVSPGAGGCTGDGDPKEEYIGPGMKSTGGGERV